MKTRNGFVSNSSSSSFVVALDKGPADLDLGEVMRIFDVGPQKGEVLLRDLLLGFLATVPTADICPTCGHNRKADDWDYDAEEETATAEFAAQNPGAFFYSLDYSDNDGVLMSELEHGDHWSRVKHLRFSHH